MIVSRSVSDNLTKASWIRRLLGEGARLEQERGADKVFDFTLGNPEIEPPALWQRVGALPGLERALHRARGEG